MPVERLRSNTRAFRYTYSTLHTVTRRVPHDYHLTYVYLNLYSRLAVDHQANAARLRENLSIVLEKRNYTISFIRSESDHPWRRVKCKKRESGWSRKYKTTLMVWCILKKLKLDVRIMKLMIIFSARVTTIMMMHTYEIRSRYFHDSHIMWIYISIDCFVWIK